MDVKRIFSLLLSCILLLCCLIPCLSVKADAVTSYNFESFSGRYTTDRYFVGATDKYTFEDFNVGGFPSNQPITTTTTGTSADLISYIKLDVAGYGFDAGNYVDLVYMFPEFEIVDCISNSEFYQICFYNLDLPSNHYFQVYSDGSRITNSTGTNPIFDYTTIVSEFVYRNSEIVGVRITGKLLDYFNEIRIISTPRLNSNPSKTTSIWKHGSNDFRLSLSNSSFSSSDYRFLWVKHENKSFYSPGDTVQFYADWDYAGSGDFDKSVFWSCDSSFAGTYIDSNGLLTIDQFESAAYITVSALSVDDPSISAKAVIPVDRAGMGSLNDPSVTIPSFDDEYTGEGAPSESNTPVVTIFSPAGYVYPHGAQPAPLTVGTNVATDITNGNIVSYQWYCIAESDFFDYNYFDMGTSSSILPITAYPGTYEYFCVVTNTVTVDGVEKQYSTVSDSYHVYVYFDDSPDLSKKLDKIIENQDTIIDAVDGIEGSLDDVNANLDKGNGFLSNILEAIKTLITGGDSQEDEQFRQEAEQNRQDFEDSMDVLDDMTMPDYEDIDTDFDDILDNDNTDDGIGLASQFFEKIFSNEIIFTVFFIAFILALVSYAIFGKR